MRGRGNIRLAVSIFIAIAMALILPGLSIAGSLEPPSYAVDGSGNPIPTMQPKTACRGEFFVNNDGTVTDCKTGLIWMQDANCFSTKLWSEALNSCSTLASGSGSCGLHDGSLAGDWHLPTIEELKTLPNRNYSGPALSNAKGDGQWVSGDAFNNVQLFFWSATTYAVYTSHAWYMHMGNGVVSYSFKTDYMNVWCVRGGQ